MVTFDQIRDIFLPHYVGVGMNVPTVDLNNPQDEKLYNIEWQIRMLFHRNDQQQIIDEIHQMD